MYFCFNSSTNRITDYWNNACMQQQSWSSRVLFFSLLLPCVLVLQHYAVVVLCVTGCVSQNQV